MIRTAPHLFLAGTALLLGTLPLSVRAESSIASSVSEGLSASVGSASTSVQKSSDSSSKTNRVAAGDYKIIDVAELPARPEMLRLRLQALAEGGEEFILTLPRQTVEQGRLAQGQIVSAKARPYGVEFAKADTAFFLVLDDDWHRELQSRPVLL